MRSPKLLISDVAVAGHLLGADRSALARGTADLGTLLESFVGRFVRGVVLHLGERTLPFGDRLAAWPLSALWA